MQQRAWFFLAAGWLLGLDLQAQSVPQLLPPAHAVVWQRAEFRVTGAPMGDSPFDPDSIKLDATFTAPSGKSVSIPGFWFQEYKRALVSGRESLTKVGTPEWRFRFAPQETGAYTAALTISTNGQLFATSGTNFWVDSGSSNSMTGYLRVSAGGQYFERSDGKPLPLVGENVCWHHERGTYDYDDWFGAMHAAGENYARLWMCPWAFGIEAEANTRTNYRLDRAWQLDYVFNTAEQKGMYLLLCLDYHGMYETTPDYWGGNNNWPLNPYNVTNGGPCLNPNGFFTNSAAQTIYQKRLRYLVARYGYSPSLAAWQFFNEIDNEYSHLVPADVAAWHGRVGTWLRANDPFGHMVTTSMTGSSDRPEVWSLPQLDFACYHSYGEAGPANRLNSVTQDFLKRYHKPVLIDEFGVDFRGWMRTESDPFLRGFRQALWGGALGGSVGSSMSWWWENIHGENVYPLYSALRQITAPTRWGSGTWTNISFKTSGMPPGTINSLVPGGQPFDVTLSLNGAWGGKPAGVLAVANPAAANYSSFTLNTFFHGTAHQELRVPCRLNAWLTNNARLVMHLNSVSSGAILAVKSDGTQLYRTNLPNLDGGWEVNKEYNQDVVVSLPAGKHVIEIANTGSDWFYLDWIRLEQALPATYTGDWQPSPGSIGLSGSRESLIYVVAPGVSFPASATNMSLPSLTDQKVVLTNWPKGSYVANWYDPATGAHVGTTTAAASNSELELGLPAFTEDLVGVINAQSSLSALGIDGEGNFQMRIEAMGGLSYKLQESVDLSSWTELRAITNDESSSVLTVPIRVGAAQQFFRVEQF